jgi:hypothetical protein
MGRIYFAEMFDNFAVLKMESTEILKEAREEIYFFVFKNVLQHP